MYGAAIVLIGLAGVIWLLTGNPGYTNLAFNGVDWAITFGSSGNFTIFGFVILALLGIEVPLNMGAEVASERSVTRYLIQPEAIGLYEQSGYSRIPNFGIYVGSEESVCFEKQIYNRDVAPSLDILNPHLRFPSQDDWANDLKSHSRTGRNAR